MQNYFPKSKKSKRINHSLNQGIYILQSVGIPINDKTERQLEKMAMCFLAVAGVTTSWKSVKSLNDGRLLKTREVIKFINEQFEENISSGSYDDIRRKDLKLLVLAGLVINSGDNPGAATNDPRRGYSIEPEFAGLIKTFGTNEWTDRLDHYLKTHETLSEILSRKRSLQKIPVTLPDGIAMELSSGEHNLLQKEIVEQFLPRFGKGCQILYIGDTVNKILHIEKETLEHLNFFELSHEKLPDIIAYEAEQNWLYLIEAVYSSGAMSETRVLELKRMTEKCAAKIIFVTAFLKKSDFRKWALNIAWETEVWIAESPDHLIHFDGEKYLTPYL